MALDEATVAKIAKLARLRVPDDRLKDLAAALSNILTWIEQLGEVDTEGVAPMASVAHAGLRQREDLVDDGGYADDVLKNAPAPADGFFTVPKVIE